jgi:hypothetical protein
VNVRPVDIPPHPGGTGSYQGGLYPHQDDDPPLPDNDNGEEGPGAEDDKNDEGVVIIPAPSYDNGDDEDEGGYPEKVEP